MKRMAAVMAALAISGAAFAAEPGETTETTQMQQQPSTDVRNWHGHDVVLLPPWQSQQSALGQDDTSGHIP